MHAVIQFFHVVHFWVVHVVRKVHQADSDFLCRTYIIGGMFQEVQFLAGFLLVVHLRSVLLQCPEATARG